VAQERLRITLDAVDKTKRAFKGIESSLGRLRQRIFNLQTLFASLGAGFILKSFIDVGSEVENLRVRFNFLFGDVAEGQKAFKGLVDFASKVPFTLQEIAQASGNLAVISKDANELARNLEIAGNVAAVTGLDFRTVGEQLQRSFSGGIAAADLFRERGVRALLGFKNGATVTAEETVEKFNEIFGRGGKFGDASKVLSTTFTGTLSMLSDKLFKFKLDVAEADIFDFAKASLAVINDLIEKNGELLRGFAQSFGKGLVNVIEGLIIGSAQIYSTIRGVFEIIGKSFAGLLDFIKALPSGIREIGIIGFFLLGARGKLVILSIGYLIKKLGIDLEKVKKDMGIAGDEANKFSKETQQAEKFLELVKKQVTDNVIKVNEMYKEIAKANAEAGKVKETFVGISLSLKEISEKFLEQANKSFKSINETIAKGILTGIKSISQGIAESIVLGKRLEDVFRNIAQRILVNVIAKLIEERLIKIANLILDKAKTSELAKQLTIMKTMATLSRISGITGFFGKILGTTTSTGIDTSVISPFAEGGTFKAGQPMMVGERGREMIIPETGGRVIKNEDLGMMGGANITFNVNAVDVRGVRELLIENRSTITNLINQALNQQGRKALV